MTRFLLFSFLILTISSCQTFRIQNFANNYEVKQKLPPLDVEFDEYSFGPDYADIYNIPNVIIAGSLNVEETVENMTTELTIKHDTRLIFEREVRNNLSAATGPISGYAVCRKGLRSNGFKSYLQPVVSIMTLGIANLFGYPYAYMKDELEIVVEIYNNENELVGRYAGFGYGEAKLGLYTGYTKRDTKRIAHAEAFVNAMMEIKDKISDDHLELTRSLAGS